MQCKTELMVSGFDIDDFNGYSDTPQAGYVRSVRVEFAGNDFGVANTNAKLITVRVQAPQGETMSLSAYRFNF